MSFVACVAPSPPIVGDLESFLIEITAHVLAQVDDETGRPFVDIVLDQA